MVNLLWKRFLSAALADNPLLGLYVLAALLRLVPLVFIILHPERALEYDTESYWVPAVNLLAGRGFSACLSAPYYPDVFRTPVYPLFLSGFMALGLSHAAWICTGQVILDLFTFRLIIFIAEKLGGRRVGIWAGVGYAVNLTAAVQCSQVLSESLFTFLFTATLLLWLRILERPDWKNAAVFGFVWAISALCRPILWPLALFFIMGSLWYAWNKQTMLTAKSMAVAIVAAVLFIAPWMVRNATITGKPIISSIGTWNLYAYEAIGLQALVSGIREDSLRRQRLMEIQSHIPEDNLFCTPHFYYLNEFRDSSFEIISKNPALWIKSRFIDAPRCFFPAANDLLEQAGITTGNRNTLSVWKLQGWRAAVKHYFKGDIAPLFWLAPWLGVWFFWLTLAIVGSIISWRQHHFFKLLALTALYFILVPRPVNKPGIGELYFSFIKA